MFRFWNKTPDAQAQANEKTKSYLTAGQYLILTYSAYNLLTGSPVSAVISFGMASYLEKSAVKYYQFIQPDPTKAEHIAKNPSNLTKFSDHWKPIFNKVKQAVEEDVSTIFSPKKR